MPPNDPLIASLTHLADALQRLAARSDDARDAIRALADTLHHIADTPSTDTTAEPAHSDRPTPTLVSIDTPHDPATLPTAPTPQPLPAEAPRPVLRPKPITGPRVVAPADPILDAEVAAAALAAGLGAAGSIAPRHDEPTRGPAPTAGSAIDIALDSIARRCRIKADSCAFAIARNNAGFEPHKPWYDRLRAEADTVQPCYLWAIQRETASLEDALLETAQGCYTNLADAADLAHLAPSDDRAIELLAEAQGAVFVLLQGIDLARGDDRDQKTAWAWLRQRAEQAHIDPRLLDAARDVDPSAWRGLQARLHAARQRLDTLRQSQRAQRQAIKTIAYHASRITDAEESDDLAHDWRKIADACDALLDAGAQPSDPQLADLLAPIADRLPEPLLQRPSLASIMPFLDQRLTDAEQQDSDDPAPARRVTDELLKARELLRGKVVVLIGGKCRHKSKRLIERELELQELRWISSDPHESIAPFEAEIARPDVAAVLLMIRWASHSYEGVKDFCLAHDKPYIRIPAGYNPNQLAHQLLIQQGDRLTAPTTSATT